MSFVMTNFAKRLLVEGWPEDSDRTANPFSTQGKIKFDALRFEPVKNVLGGYRIVFMFAGRDVFMQDMPDFKPGMILTVTGVEGAMDVDIK